MCREARAKKVLDAMTERNIDCIVAPYEADAQLDYLNLSGIAQVILTEDSDLTVFGCHKVIFKLKDTGQLQGGPFNCPPPLKILSFFLPPFCTGPPRKIENFL